MALNITVNDSDLLANSSSTNLTPYQRSIIVFVKYATILIMVTSVALNASILYVFYRNSQLRTPFNFYLINLALSDLLYSFLSMPMSIISMSFDQWPYGLDLCWFLMWGDNTFWSSSLYTVFCMGFDRIWALYWPIKYRTVDHRKATLKTIFWMHVFNQATTLPEIIGFRFISTNPLLCQKTDDNPFWSNYDLFMQFGLCLFPQVILIFSFCLIIIKLPKKNLIQPRKMLPDSANEELAQNQVLISRATKERKTVNMFVCLTVCMLICWFPQTLFWGIYHFDQDIYDFSVDQVTSLLSYLITVAHPLLYQLTNRNIYDAVKGMFGNVLTEERQLTVSKLPVTVAHGSSSSIHR